MNALSIRGTTNPLTTAITNTGVYCSVNLSDADAKKKVFNALNKVDKNLKEEVNCPVTVRDFYIEPAELPQTDNNGNPVVDEATGEVVTTIAPRIILFDADGISHGCCSQGVYNSLVRLVAMFGTPDKWDEPITVTPQLLSTKKGQVMNLNII